MEVTHYINEAMETFNGLDMVSKSPYTIHNDRLVYDCDGQLIGELRRGKSWYRECTLTDTSLCYHGLKNEETWAFEVLMNNLRPLEKLWIKINQKHSTLPDVESLIRWACNEIEKDKNIMIDSAINDSHLMKTTISILDFKFIASGYGHFKVTYTDEYGNTYTNTTGNMPLIDATKNADEPKAEDLERLKKICKG